MLFRTLAILTGSGEYQSLGLVPATACVSGVANFGRPQSTAADWLHLRVPGIMNNCSFMARSPAQLKAARDRARERLLDAALMCFAERGYASTTSRDIAAAAGVSLGLAYRYFRSKDEMLVAIVKNALAHVQRDVAASDGVDRDPVEALIKSAIETVRVNPRFWRLFHQLRVHPSGAPDVDRLIRRAGQAARARIAFLLRAGGVEDADCRAAALFAAIDGSVQHYLLDPSSFPIDAVAAELARRFRMSPTASRAKARPTRRAHPGDSREQ